MPVVAPAVLRQALGEEVMVEFVPWVEQVVREQTIPWIEQVVQEKAVPRDGYREVLSRLDVLEHDVAGIKEDIRLLRDEMHGEIHALRLEMNERFDRVNERFDRMSDQFNTRLDRMNEQFVGIERHMEMRLDQMSDRMLVQTRWLVGSIALFGTIITILLAIAQFTP